MSGESEIFVGLRVETKKNKEEVLETIIHNTRKHYQQSVKNDNGIIVLENDTWEKVKGTNSSYSNRMYNQLEKDYEELVKEHKRKSKSFHTKRTRTFSECVLYFSKGINEDYKLNPIEFMKRVKNLIKEFENENNTKVLNTQIHNDEEGNIHIHFMFLNYDNENGKSLNFTHNKENGGRLQDLGFKHFETFGKGYNRGVKKEKPTKHLSIEEYKEYKETQKENERLKEENKKLKEEIEKQGNNLVMLNSKIEELKEVKSEYTQLLKEIYQELEELKDIDKGRSEEMLGKVFGWLDRNYKSNEKKHKTIMKIRKNIREVVKKQKKKLTNQDNTQQPGTSRSVGEHQTPNLSNYNKLK